MVQSLDQTEHCDRLRRFRHLVQPGASSGWSPPGVALAYPADDAARRRAHQSAGVGPRHTPDSGLERRAARARRAMELKPPAKRAASPSIGKACSPWWLATAACALSWRQARREWVITVSRTQPLRATLSPLIVNKSILQSVGCVKHKGRRREREDPGDRAAENWTVSAPGGTPRSTP